MSRIITTARNTIKQLLFRNTVLRARMVFILSAPRSGSTHLYEILRRCDSVVSLDEENDSFWWSLFPYSRLDLPNDYISAEEISPQLAEKIRADLSLHVAYQLLKQHLFKFLKLRVFNQETTYLEKTVANCFHLEVLAILFPGAKFIHLVRDGHSTISSMIEGWESKRFLQRPLPFPDGSSIDYWTFPIPPGWENIAQANLNEICAWSWLQHNKYVLDFFEMNPTLKNNLLRVSYEELINNTDETIDSLVRFCGFRRSGQVDSYLKENRRSRTTVSNPAPMKWKKENAEEILEIEESIMPMMIRLGYPDTRVEKAPNSQGTS